MPTARLQELGLNLLEEQSAQPPYSEYWTQTFLPALYKVRPPDEELKARIERTASFIGNVSTAVIRENNLQGLADYPELFQDRTSLNESKVIMWWYSRLGNFNTLQGARPDLLDAADILLRCSAERSEADQWRDRDELQAAELMHVAAWTETDTELRDELLDVVAGMYRDMCQRPTLNRNNKRVAHGYLSDIEFQQCSTRTDYECLMRQEAAYLYRQFDAGFTELGGLGKIFEDVLILGMRRALFGMGKQEDFKLRHAFQHEDGSLGGKLKPKPSFDIVLQEYSNDGIIASPIESKHALERPDSEPRGMHNYFPGIVMAGFRVVNPRDIKEALGVIGEVEEPPAGVTTATLKPFIEIESILRKLKF